VQGLQLKNASTYPQVLTTGLVDGLQRLGDAGVLPKDQVRSLWESYCYLRDVEARLRLMKMRARHDLPEDERELQRLALLLSLGGGDSLRDECLARMHSIRQTFLEIFPVDEENLLTD